MIERPFACIVQKPTGIPDRYDNHIERRLSSMTGQFRDHQAYEKLVQQSDRVIYEVYEGRRVDDQRELAHGVSIVKPGKVGDEFFMTKGHFHAVLETAELYYCIQGEGMIVMENPEGDWAAERMSAGVVLYVPPRWAHRSVNTHPHDELVVLFAYRGDAGHDYQSIERRGFRKLVVAAGERTEIVDNPRWIPLHQPA